MEAYCEKDSPILTNRLAVAFCKAASTVIAISRAFCGLFISLCNLHRNFYLVLKLTYIILMVLLK